MICDHSVEKRQESDLKGFIILFLKRERKEKGTQYSRFEDYFMVP